MIVRMGKTLELHLNLAFLTDLKLIKQGKLPLARTQFRIAAEKHLIFVWKNIEKKAKVQMFEPFKSCELFLETFLSHMLNEGKSDNVF